MTGCVLSIERCSLNDGPGIRTTVFLKGCPLTCVWCHNPESQAAAPEILFFGQRCGNCSACARACEKGCHSFPQGKHVIDRSACTACGKCAAACGQNALEIKGSAMKVDEIIAVVEKDKRYFSRSGGGMTLSGGEPLTRPDFSRDLLEAAKSRGIHTCLETCGFAAPDTIAGLASLTDLFLFDYKATDPAEHKRLTGVENGLILENLLRLAGMGKEIILRCPLVAGINDDEGHLRAIAGLSRKYPGIRHVEIMAYHDMGVSKSRYLGRSVPLENIKTADESQKQLWLGKLNDLGCRNARLG